MRYWPTAPPEGFVWTKRGKLMCNICNRSGWPDGSWMDGCKRGHPFSCHTCGQPFTTMTGKTHHERIKHEEGGFANDVPSTA